MAIEWVFFDIGDVLLDENVPHLYWCHSLLLAMRRNGARVGWDEYHARIRQCVRQEPETAVTDAARHFVDSNADWEKIYAEGRAVYEAARKPRPYGLLLDGITPVVQDLARDYNLGIIANQHPQVLEGLDDYGIGALFGVKAIDEIVGLHKPDPALFRWALERAGCAPDQALMVGDRPDVDIAPAHSVGMRAVRFRRGLLYSLYDARTAIERAEAEVRTTGRLAQVVRGLAQDPASLG